MRDWRTSAPELHDGQGRTQKQDMDVDRNSMWWERGRGQANLTKLIPKTAG